MDSFSGMLVNRLLTSKETINLLLVAMFLSSETKENVYIYLYIYIFIYIN